MTNPDHRTQQQIDDDLAQLRAELMSVITPEWAYRIRGVAHMSDRSAAGVYAELMYHAGGLVDVALAAMMFHVRPDDETVRALTEAIRQFTSGPRTLTGALDAIRALNGSPKAIEN